MKNLYIKFLILTIIIIPFATVSFAEVNTTASSTEVEISLPLQKEDFLLFYGLTNDKVKNGEIIKLRNDFMLKFKDLKDNYAESFHKVADGYDLVSSIPEEDVDKLNPTIKSENVVNPDVNINKSKIPSEDKASTSEDVSLTKQTPVDTVKKYIIQNTKDNISPIVNIVGSKINIKTESSTWFQKIKSWFGW